ncbi:MAG: metallophosphoesterase [Treponema sp.]|nr:metallophosphoesterase [Treponema sp.]
MKILCVSDYIDPLVYSNAIKERFKDIDVILSAGDLPMEYIDFIVSSLNKPAFFVFGNHNLKEFPYYHPEVQTTRTITQKWNLSHSHGADYLGFKTARCCSLLLAGTSGSLKYNNGHAQYTEQQMTWRLIKLIPRLIFNKLRYGRYLDIFLTHAAPFGISDREDPCHKGFKCFLWFMKLFKPKYLIHGHIHLYSLQDVRHHIFEETEVINVYSHYVLEIK